MQTSNLCNAVTVSFTSRDNIKDEYGFVPGPLGPEEEMMMHEDLPDLVDIALQIQNLGNELFQATGEPWVTRQTVPKSHLSPNETIFATLNFNNMLQERPEARGQVRRGQYPLIDSLVDDFSRVLRHELFEISQAKQMLAQVMVEETSSNRAQIKRKRATPQSKKPRVNRRRSNKKPKKKTSSPPRKQQATLTKHAGNASKHWNKIVPALPEAVLVSQSVNSTTQGYKCPPSPVTKVSENGFGDDFDVENLPLLPSLPYPWSSSHDVTDLGLCEGVFSGENSDERAGLTGNCEQQESLRLQQAPSFNLEDIDQEIEEWAQKCGFL